MKANKITGANAGGSLHLPIRTRWAAPVAQFCRWQLSVRTFLSSLLLAGAFTGCKPTARDFMSDSARAFQPYVTGDVYTAKAALLAEEKVIKRYEAAQTPGLDFHHAYLCTYARLCAVYLHLGDTNRARDYFQLAVTHRSLKRSFSTVEVTMESLMESTGKLDAQFNPKWRQTN